MKYLIRHAHKVDNSMYAELNEKGKNASYEFGSILKEKKVIINTIYSSPFSRCLQTAKHIVDGYESKIEIIESKLLGDPGVFVKDDQKAMSIFGKYKLIDIINMQLKDTLLDGFEDTSTAVKQLKEFIDSRENNALFISHDAIISTFAGYSNQASNMKKEEIVGYLEGYAICEKLEYICFHYPCI